MLILQATLRRLSLPLSVFTTTTPHRAPHFKRVISSSSLSRHFKMSDKVKQPDWHKPVQKMQVPKLHILNSLTKKKEEFIPVNGNQVTWYNCGPTVYDASHIGHARTYLTIDIMRRIFEDYFGYDVLLITNVTDIDDKIILRARQSYLFEKAKKGTDKLHQCVIDMMESAWKEYVEEYFGREVSVFEQWSEYVATNKDRSTGDMEKDAKFKMRLNLASSAHAAIITALQSLAANDTSKETADRVLNGCKDVLSHHLDKREGATVTDPLVFRDLAAHWENEFFKDMDALNVKRPDILTRVSEYVPEIVDFIQKIMDNGFAYESQGSVYFDTVKFNSNPKHHYAKLEPWSASNLSLIADAEGALSQSSTSTAKKSPSDFALWKKSKPGEPIWPSPWSEGRPGWHIECSAMACDIAGDKLDIHSGGIDLAFPHHDNEIAQSEAHYGCDQWVNYFVHPGHLHIEGQKMSKSLKNFTSIQEALQKYSPNQIRILFLMHPWENTLDFKASSLQAALGAETNIQNFLINVKALIQEEKTNPAQFTGSHSFRKNEKELLDSLLQIQSKVHSALCDNINTSVAMSLLLELINKSNVYLKITREASQHPNTMILSKVAKYITKMTKCFGLTESGPEMGYGMSQQGKGGSSEDMLMPYLRVLSTFRDNVRAYSREKKAHSEFLALCDSLRDNDLIELGVSLDDRDDGTALVKLADPALLRKIRDEKKSQQAAKLAAKQASLRKNELKKLEKLHKGRLSPKEYFMKQVDEYSKWDENGLPTHDKGGEELSKGKSKKVQKEWGVLMKLWEDYQKELKEQGGKIDWSLLKEEWEKEGKKWEV
ncbi:tRNA synthetases class I (C) catalytic domain-containing protein [Paraphysoderma sedebokerense]|nr:tRNA synthetases class I (C) catalytic domain-containing protein [Paraphysoderma sedebokerense]